jgi:hypothetical protein
MGTSADRQLHFEIAGIAPWVLVGVLGLDKIGLMHVTC